MSKIKKIFPIFLNDAQFLITHHYVNLQNTIIFFEDIDFWQKMHPSLENSTTRITIVDALCNWRRGDDILEMIIDWLNKDLTNKKQNNSEMSKPKKAKGVRFDEASQKPRPGTCSSHIFTNPEFSVCNVFYRKKKLVILAFHDICIRLT